MSNTCIDTQGSNCVAYQGPAMPCLQVCAGASMSEVTYQIGNAACTALNAVDLTGINLGCLYEANLISWSCPVGQSFRADSGAYVINGTAGYCEACPTPSTCYITGNVPVQTSTPNPVPAPTTLKGILELMISKIPCCDPCKGVNIPTTEP